MGGDRLGGLLGLVSIVLRTGAGHYITDRSRDGRMEMTVIWGYDRTPTRLQAPPEQPPSPTWRCASRTVTPPVCQWAEKTVGARAGEQ